MPSSSIAYYTYYVLLLKVSQTECQNHNAMCHDLQLRSTWQQSRASQQNVLCDSWTVDGALLLKAHNKERTPNSRQCPVDFLFRYNSGKMVGRRYLRKYIFCIILIHLRKKPQIYLCDLPVMQYCMLSLRFCGTALFYILILVYFDIVAWAPVTRLFEPVLPLVPYIFDKQRLRWMASKYSCGVIAALCINV